VSGSGQLADLCPLCSCLPLGNPGDVRIGFQQPAAVATETFGSQQGTLPFISEEIDLNEPSDSTSQLPAGRESMKAGDSSKQEAANTAMLNHIADHLQFLALLTTRLSTEKLADGAVQDFSSSRAVSSDGAPGKRSTLDDKLEICEETNLNVLQENTPLEAESTQHPPEIIPNSVSDGWSDVSCYDKDPMEDKLLQEMVILGAFQSHLVKGTSLPIDVGFLSLHCGQRFFRISID
jgi:hypothetical protein